MDFLTEMFETPAVQVAVVAFLTALFTLVVTYLKVLTAKLAARLAAIHAEAVSATTSIHGEEKMEVALNHVTGSLPRMVRPGRKATIRLIEEALPQARASFPPNGSPSS